MDKFEDIDELYKFVDCGNMIEEYKVAKAEYSEYQAAVVKWEKQTGKKLEDDSLKARLNQKQQQVKHATKDNQISFYKKDRDISK